MSVEVSLNTPLADALSNVVQPKLTEIGWNTGGLDDSALGEYIILMLVNGKTQEQIAAELSNDLLSLGPDDTGAIDFARWLFEQVHLLDAQINGGSASQTQATPQGQANPSYPNGEQQQYGEDRQLGISGTPDADMTEAMDDVQDGSIPTGPKSMRTNSRTGNRRLMGQISKAMDRSGDAVLHRVRPQQGTERINMHNRPPPKGPRNEQSQNRRGPSNIRVTGVANGGMPNGGVATPLMNASPQQQMALFAMLEEQARMMSQIFSPQQQSFMSGMPQPAINPNFRPGGQAQSQQPDRSLFERVERHPHRQNGSFNKRQHYENADPQSRTDQSTGAAPDNMQGAVNGDLTSSMEVESSQKSQSETPSNTICKFNLKCTKKECPFAHQSPAAPPGITLDLSSDCTFGARCQNRKCVMRHPSPAQNPAHSTVDDCKFFPNCTNPICPFRHPTSVPMCRFGENCTREGCKFKHVTITCRFNPCLNATCPYKHAEGQKKAKFGDNVWKADGDQGKEHVSERKFVEDNTTEELVVPEPIPAHSSEPSSLGAEGIIVRTSHTLRQTSHIVWSYQSTSLRRSLTTNNAKYQANPRISNVAVLGGGITGLASAHYLAEQLPHAQVTLFEGNSKLGGWLRSNEIDVGNGKVILEQGPRTLRPSKPNGWVTLDLIQDLRLEDQVLMTSKDSVAAQNRFIYFPDHLVRLPGPGASSLNTFYTLLSEPLFKGLTWACMTEFIKPARAKFPRHLNDDESIGSFFSRRLNSHIADNIVSAGIHGIYAGDIYQLSVRSIFPWIWYAEEAMGSVTEAVVRKWNMRWAQDAALDAQWAKAPPVSQTMEAIRGSSVYTFKKGIGQLADRLVAKLRERPNINLRTNTVVHGIQLEQRDNSQYMQVSTQSYHDTSSPTKEEPFDHVISTISGRILDTIARPRFSLSVLSHTSSVTVMVVNLYFSNPSVLPAQGFGYLLPRSLSFEQNPERALGVVFDSHATIGQDEIPGTKVTVMLGGHWWDGWEAYPDEEHGSRMARAILKRHLGVAAEPQVIGVGLWKDCIPQYTVGHHSRMAQANEALKKFNGRLRVAGSSYSGVGLNDCVRSARDVVMGLVEGSNDRTGLEFFHEGNLPITSQKKRA
ncbi:MAG: hypothetical protein Q9181_000493 [Wetmoreana brouardii]